MKSYRLLRFSALFGLGACAPAHETGKFLADNIKDSVYETAYAIEDWASTPPKGKGKPLPQAHRYCYRVQGDILCYRQPMPGMEYRLVGYQGYGAPQPPSPTMQLLPKSKLDESMTPENKLANSKPVFGVAPEGAKIVEPGEDPGAASDPSASEVLPDPTHLPQL